MNYYYYYYYYSPVLHRSVNKVFIACTCATVELLFLSFMFSRTP